MSATVPYRVKDLIHTYGWDFMPRLAALGINYQAEAQVLFVDSGATNALDADDGYHGHSFENPLATIDYANGLCVADEGAIILVAPGYNENLGDAQIDFDVAGVACIFLGSGPLRGRIDFDHANASINIGANGVTLVNLGLLPSITGVLIGVDVETTVTDFKMVDCEFMIGEDGSGADEFVKAIQLTSGNHDCIFKNVKILAHASAANATHGIHVAAASNRLTFQNVIIDGPYATGGIVEAAAGLNHVVEDCSIDTTGTNFSFHGSSTYAKYTRNVDAGVDSEEAEPLIEVVRGTGDYPTGITDNSILAYMLGKGATASASTFVNTTDSLEAISDKISAIDNTTNLNTAVSATPTARSLQDILEKDGTSGFARSTDSLQAIRDHLDGATVLGGLQLDHLMQTTTGVAADADLETYAVAGSLMAHIMSTGADVTTFKASTDSLEAISNAVATLDTGVTAAVAATPTASSVQDMLQKDATQDYNRATDSLEALSDKAGGFSGDGGALQDDSIKASLDLAHTDIDAILADTITISGGALPATATADSLQRFVAGGDTALGTQLPASTSLYDTTKNLRTVAIDGSSLPVTNTLSDILHKNGSYTYDNTSDSLEAIADTILVGTTALGGLQLDHLLATTTGVAADSDLETYCVAGSLMAHILSATADVTTFKPSTDSLEAISVALAAGTGANSVLVSNNLDHVAKVTTTVAADGDLSSYVVDGSILAHMLSPGAAVATDFNASTDSLGAISAMLRTGTTALGGLQLDHLLGTTTGVAADSDLETYCVAGSLMSHILSTGADVTTFKPSTHSLQAIGADTDLILADTAAIDPGAMRIATATTTNWALSGTNKMFTVSGPVKAKIWGIVAATVKAVAMELKVIGTPTAPGGAIDITAVLDCNADAVGTVYKLNTTLGGAMVAATGGVTADNGIEVILPAGTVTLGSAAAEDGGGSIVWYCEYEPLVAGATVTATP